MPKIKSPRGSSLPPLPPIVIKEVPLVVKPPEKPKPAPVPAADPEPPHYY